MTRLTGEDRIAAADLAKRSYEVGMSVREIAVSNGWSYGLTHTLLQDAGVTLRPRGTRAGDDGPA